MDFEKDIYNNPNTVMVMVGASWCNPCKFMKPLFAALKKEWADRVTMAYLDVDDEANKAFAQEHDVKTMPTFIVFKGGVEVARLAGRQPERAMVATLTEHA
jgi:thioredoxin-like negative regulator of GroEL